jgi:hypothetical protein
LNKKDKPFSLRTGFAAHVTLNQDAIKGEITIDTTPEQRSTVQQSTEESEIYRIMDDYGTSFLWKKENDHVDSATVHVDDATELFPHTAPFFEDSPVRYHFRIKYDRAGSNHPVRRIFTAGTGCI